MPAAPDGACPQGVLAFGDSITNAGGDIQFGVALQSWALWTARGMGVPYTPYAVDGALVSDVTQRQIPLFLATNADPDARYALGCLYVGTNDIRVPDWDPVDYELSLGRAAAFLAARCERVLMLTIPLTMGRPADPDRITRANAIIQSVAATSGALVLDLSDLRARNLVMHDHVHWTAFGQIAVAERALDLLAGDGVEVRVRPKALIIFDPAWYQRLRWDVTYVTRVLRLIALDALRRWRTR